MLLYNARWQGGLMAIRLSLVLALVACSSKPVQQPVPSEAQVVFAQVDSGFTRLYSAGESGSAKVAITPAGVRAAYAGAIGRRVIWAELGSDATVTALHSGDALLGAVAAGKYRAPHGAWAL